MGFKDICCVFFLVFLLLIIALRFEPVVAIEPTHPIDILSRSNFSQDFVFCSSSSAYQYEGAAFMYGKGPSILDTFTHQYPEKIDNGSNGDIAVDQYHRYKEDIAIMKQIGFDAYKLSISWPRILPKGKLSGGVNNEGIQYYNNLINELLANGIQPYVTLFHWDLPQSLEDEYEGFLSRQVIEDFRDFADLCFKEFGDRVKYWIIFSDPYNFVINGYTMGDFAPERCTVPPGCFCENSSTEPYIVGHHQILAHAAVVDIYKTKYQAQKGEIGVTLYSDWYVPYSNSEIDKKATSGALDFSLGWFLHPLVYGDYPSIMRAHVKERLPKFTKDEILGRDGVPIGPRVSIFSWLAVYPQGLRDLLIYTKNTYNNPIIYITQNGFFDFDDPQVKKLTTDESRVAYYRSHLNSLYESIKAGVRVKAYFVWLFLDVQEWSSGYTIRFGLVYIDFKNQLKRTIKNSGKWFHNFLST